MSRDNAIAVRHCQQQVLLAADRHFLSRGGSILQCDRSRLSEDAPSPPPGPVRRSLPCPSAVDHRRARIDQHARDQAISALLTPGSNVTQIGHLFYRAWTQLLVELAI